MKFFKRKENRGKKLNTKQMLASLSTELVEHVDDTTESFENVSKDVKWLSGRIDNWARQFKELRDELATNGVVRDLRKLQKEHKELVAAQMSLLDLVETRFSQLETNGVATSINELNREVFGTQKDKKGGIFSASLLRAVGAEDAIAREATLAGKVDAIIEHLGLDLTIQPATSTPSKVVAKKKPTAKKKRRY